MDLRVKEICKQKKVQLKDIAEKMGIAKESLSRALNGNPQLDTLIKIAEALEVDIIELFPQPAHTVRGYLEVDGIVYKIDNKNQLEEIVKKLK